MAMDAANTASVMIKGASATTAAEVATTTATEDVAATAVDAEVATAV